MTLAEIEVVIVEVGCSEANRVKVNVRLICVTNRSLQQMVLNGKFRLDLCVSRTGLRSRLEGQVAGPREIREISLNFKPNRARYLDSRSVLFEEVFVLNETA